MITKNTHHLNSPLTDRGSALRVEDEWDETFEHSHKKGNKQAEQM